MALISCPECKCEVSDVAVSCPKCGYPINPVKHKYKKTWILIIVIIILFFSLLVFGSMLYVYYRPNVTTDSSEKTDFDIFKYTSDNEYEPFALTTDNNILGKDISTVLENYFNGKEYEYNCNEYFCSYTFTESIEYPIGTEPQLVIYVDTGSSKISVVEYSYRMSVPASNSSTLTLHSILSGLTDYYDAEPCFTYVNKEGDIEYISGDSFFYLLKNNKSLYNVTWETDNLLVNWCIPNTTDYKKLQCSISFSKLNE